MRILIVHNRYRQRGGEDVVAESEAQLLRSRGHEVRVFEKTNSEVGGLRGAVDAIWSRRARAELGVLLADFAPDVAHVHNVFHAISPAIYGAIAGRGVPIVQTLHNFRLYCIRGTFERDGAVCERCAGHSLWRGAMLKCYRNSYSASSLFAANLQLHRMLGSIEGNVHRFITLNEFCRRKFVECGIPDEKIDVKPNFTDIDDIDDCRPRPGGIYVGRMAVEKGVAVLAGALEVVAPDIFTTIGDGPEAAVLRSAKGVNFVGPLARDAVIERMRSAEYLVMPSVWYETFGLVMIEAFACRLPVIASNMGAMAELVEHGRTGLLFEGGSSADLAEKMRWAQAHPQAMREMGAAARAEYERRFTSRRNYGMLMAVYKRALEGAAALLKVRR